MDAKDLIKRAKELDFAGTHPDSVFVTEIWVVFHELLVLAEELLEAQRRDAVLKCPCDNCGIGWGIAGLDGRRSCFDECVRLRKWLEDQKK